MEDDGNNTQIETGCAMTITLTGDIEKGLVEQAGKIGTSPEALAIETLRRQFASPVAAETSATQVSLVEFLGDFVGCISSDEYLVGGAQMSQDAGNQFAQGMVEKRNQGRL
jgi:hypothetical protein